MAALVSTNILPRWGRGNGGTRVYKHTAPLGQGEWRLAYLQTYCPAGAGGMAARVSTNMVPRRGRGDGGPRVYKNNGPAGQGGMAGVWLTKMRRRGGRGGGGIGGRRKTELT